jgi:thioredoxin 1
MSNDRSIEEIREQKMKELQEGSENESNNGTPTEPVYIDGQAELTETFGTHKVVLVDFYADWCGPCQMLEPVVKDVAAETDAAVAKVDVDTNQRLASEYGVQGVPTLILFADGEPVERLVGVQSKEALVNVVGQYS